MRRAQNIKHYSRPSLALGADDLTVLKENPDESIEDVLRRQLLEKDRENDKVARPSFLSRRRTDLFVQLQTQIQALQVQLAQRPPLETVQALQKEYTNLEIILQGTQRENERCMAEIERYFKYSDIMSHIQMGTILLEVRVGRRCLSAN